MNFHTPTDEEIHTAFEHGERAIRALFHDVATQMAELAQQLAKQGEVLQGCKLAWPRPAATVVNHLQATAMAK